MVPGAHAYRWFVDGFSDVELCGHVGHPLHVDIPITTDYLSHRPRLLLFIGSG